MLSKAKAIVLDSLRTLGWYLLLVVLGTVTFMIVAMAIGYVPYSDRPGPGWYGFGRTFDWGAARSVVGWGIFLSPYAAVLALILWAGARVLEVVHTPRVVVRILGALSAAYLSAYIVAGIGWYIAIGAGPIYAALVLGGTFGAIFLPKRIGRVTAAAPTGDDDARRPGLD